MQRNEMQSNATQEVQCNVSNTAQHKSTSLRPPAQVSFMPVKSWNDSGDTLPHLAIVMNPLELLLSNAMSFTGSSYILNDLSALQSCEKLNR
jgi:hypothetical protein